MSELTTYRDLKRYLDTLSDAQLDQPIQVVEPGVGDRHTLLPVIAAGTVGEMGFDFCRSSVDNRYHADEVVLLTDYNGWGKDGATSYLLEEDPASANGHKMIPQYDKGKTPPEEQWAPGALEKRHDIRRRFDESGEAAVIDDLRQMSERPHQLATIGRRLAKLNRDK